MKKLQSKLFGLLVILTVSMMTLMAVSACSKDDDKGDGGGGSVTPDPNIPELSEIKYELAPTATIVPEEVTKAVANVDTLGHKLTLPTRAAKPEVGQTLIFNTPTKQLPYGLLAKVKEVTENGNGYVVTYEDAELKDAFKDIDIPEQYISIGEYVEHIYDADGKELAFSREVETRANGSKSFPIKLPEVGWKVAKGVELTPKMSIDLMMRYVFQFGDYELSYCGINLDADVTVGADLNFIIDEHAFKPMKIYLFTIVCGAIPIGPVVLNPNIDVYGIVKADGKVTLEASISYERTIHAKMRYQKGAGLSAECNLEPEGPEALKFTFGPKFEGGLSYGVAMGGYIGIYGKTLGVRLRLNMVKKETISGKLDLLAFVGNTNDWLMPYSADPTQYPDANAYWLKALDNILKWKFNQFEDIMYNQAFAVSLGCDLHTIGVDVVQKDLPEVSYPISSDPIMPQVKIEEKDFFDFNGNDVTLKLHHKTKSVLDALTEFRTEFKRVGAKDTEQPIVKYFDFDDEKRKLLEANDKNADITSTAKVTLNGQDNYDITVYMNILNVDIPIFEGYAKTDTLNFDEIEMVDFFGNLYCKYDAYENMDPYHLSVSSSEFRFSPEYEDCLFTVKKHGKGFTFEGTRILTGGKTIERDNEEIKLSFTVDELNYNKVSSAKNIVAEYYGTSYQGRSHTKWVLKGEMPLKRANYGSLNPYMKFSDFFDWECSQADKNWMISEITGEKTFIHDDDPSPRKFTYTPGDKDKANITVYFKVKE